jgi:catechol 2,3-dioxygenase
MNLPKETRFGPVHIAVTDGDRALAVWRDLVGLTEISRGDGEIRLGIDGRPLIVLEPGAARPVVKHTSGLYHVAIHMPARHDLALVTARLAATRFPNSPTDHLVSEATYLWDLDGNGIELTFETPWRGELKSNGDDYYGVTTDGRRHSGRDAIDLHSLFGELKEDESLAAPLRAGTRIGHVHLHVSDLDKAMAFYADDGVGFGRQMFAKRIGMGDVTLGYQPHALAFNTWNGVGAPQAPEGSAGLRHFTIELPTAADVAAMRARLGSVTDTPEGFAALDPAGNALKVRVAK